MSIARRTRISVVTTASLVLGIAAALAGAGAGAAQADPTPTPSGAPVSVIIPGDSTPAPGGSTGGGSTGGGSTGGGSTGGGTGGGSTGGGTGTGTPPATNPDGSPVPPATPKADAPKLKLDKKRIEAGEWIVATASGYQAGEKAQVVIYPGAVVVSSYTVGADGSFSARFRIPEKTLTGTVTVEVTGWTSGYIANGTVTVISPSAAPAGWFNVSWVYVVVGVLGVSVLSLLIVFRGALALLLGFVPKGA